MHSLLLSLGKQLWIIHFEYGPGTERRIIIIHKQQMMWKMVQRREKDEKTLPSLVVGGDIQKQSSLFYLKWDGNKEKKITAE